MSSISDANPQVTLPSPTILQLVDQRPRLVIEQAQLNILSVGTQGPAGPTQMVPGVHGDVLFNTGGTALGVDTEDFSYSVTNKALKVSRLTGTVLDGGNF